MPASSPQKFAQLLFIYFFPPRRPCGEDPRLQERWNLIGEIKMTRISTGMSADNVKLSSKSLDSQFESRLNLAASLTSL